MWSYTAGATDLDRVRLLLTDIDSSNPLFSDEEIATFLDLEGGDVRYAAADGLEVMASSQAMQAVLLKTVRQLDTTTVLSEAGSGASRGRNIAVQLAEELRVLAQTYRDQADAIPAYEIAEKVFGPATALERIRKQRLRHLMLP